MDDKRIDEAARCYAEENSMSIEDQMGDVYDGIEELSDAYKSGAKWAINELLKDLWHPASEEPIEFAEVLAEAKITESIKTYISFKRNDALFKNWDAYSSGANITRWLYVDDLLPKEGGEK